MEGVNITFQSMITGGQRTRNIFRDMSFLNMMNSLNQIDDVLNESINQVISDNPVSGEFKNNLDEINVTEEMIAKEIDCSICLDKFKLNEKCIQLPCSETPHYFHSNCESCPGVIPWLEKNNTCPVCRTKFPTDTINEGNHIERPPSLIPTNNTDLSPEQRHGIGMDNHLIIENHNENILNRNDNILNTSLEQTIINTLDNYLRRVNHEINGTIDTGMNETINEEEIDNDLQRAIELSLSEIND